MGYANDCGMCVNNTALAGFSCNFAHAHSQRSKGAMMDFICLMRRTVNNLNPAMQSERVGRKGTVSQNGRILLANPLQSSRSTLSRGSFSNFFAFQAGMLSTPISALRGWPTVSGRFLRLLTCPQKRTWWSSRR
jgi:hypothetical protein